MDGRIHEDSARPVHLRRLGDAMARLHDQADAWTPPPDFVRIRWDHETFFGDVMVYGDTPAAECWALLPAEVRARFQAVAARMADVMPRVDADGLIHADLHLGNALFQRGDRQADRLRRLRHRPPPLRARRRPLGAAGPNRTTRRTGRRCWPATERAGRSTSPHLDDFIALRQVAFDLWYTGTAQVNPAFAARLDKVHRWSLAMLDLVA